MEPSGPFDAAEVVKFFPDKYKTRKEWHATNADSKSFNFHFANDIVLTFTGSDPCLNTDDCIKSVKAIQLKDKDSGLPDIRHNFVIGGDGYVYVGRSWMESPDVPKKLEKNKDFILSVGYIGHFGDTPSEEQENAFKDLLQIGKTNFLIWEKVVIQEYLTENPYE